MKKISKIIMIVLVIMTMSACSTKKNYISMEEAKAKALETMQGEVVSAKAKLDNRPAIYEFVIKSNDKQYIIKVTATDGTIHSMEDESHASSTQTPVTNETSPVTENTPKEGMISSEEANQVALQKVGGGTIVQNTLDYDDGRQEYDIKVSYNDAIYSIDVNATTKEITSYKEEKSHAFKQDNTNIGSDKAKQIALDKVGGGTVVKNKLDYDDGIKKYEIEIYYQNSEYEIDINAKDGTIIKYEQETH